MASVRQLKKPNRRGKRPWIVEYTDAGGVRRRATPKSGLFKDADKLRQKIEREISDEVHVPASETLTFKQGYELWQKDNERRHKIGDLAGNTLAHYRYHMGLLLPRLRARLVTQLTTLVLQEVIDELSEKYSLNTVKGAKTVLRFFLTFLVRRKILKRNIIVDEGLRLPKKRSEKPMMPDKDQIMAIIRAAERRDPTEHFQAFHARRAVVYLGLFCGLRRGEIAGLQWENVDFAQDMIYVRNSLSAYDGLKKPKTEAGERDVPMPPIVRRALLMLLSHWQLEMRFADDTRCFQYKKRVYREEFGDPPEPDMTLVPKGYVVTTRTGQPLELSNMSMDFIGWVMKKAGIPAPARKRLSLHSLRHAYASLLIEDGVLPMSLKKLVGHASVTTTHNVYGHLFPRDEAERQSVQRIAAQFDATKSRYLPLTLCETTD